MSISKLLDKVGMGKNALTYLLKNALAEGSEEITSDAVNWLADVMISQDKSEWQETLFHYQVMGFSEDEAFLAAMKEQGRKMLKDGAAGAITGTIMSGGRLAGSKIGDGIQDYKNYREAVQNGKQYYALNQLTQGGLARSLGNMNVEQSYRSMSPEAILKNSGLSSTEARFLLESNGYSVKDSPQLPSLLRDGEGGQLHREEIFREAEAVESLETEEVEKFQNNDIMNLSQNPEALYRRESNSGDFANLEIPMQKRKILQIARKYNVDMTDIRVKIQRDVNMLDSMFAGSADYMDIGRIDFFPNAFRNEEQLLRTLLHERFHVLQLRKHGREYVQDHLAEMEKAAEEASEEAAEIQPEEAAGVQAEQSEETAQPDNSAE